MLFMSTSQQSRHVAKNWALHSAYRNLSLLNYICKQHHRKYEDLPSDNLSLFSLAAIHHIFSKSTQCICHCMAVMMVQRKWTFFAQIMVPLRINQLLYGSKLKPMYLTQPKTVLNDRPILFWMYLQLQNKRVFLLHGRYEEDIWNGVLQYFGKYSVMFGRWANDTVSRKCANVKNDNPTNN